MDCTRRDYDKIVKLATFYAKHCEEEVKLDPMFGVKKLEDLLTAHCKCCPLDLKMMVRDLILNPYPLFQEMETIFYNINHTSLALDKNGVLYAPFYAKEKQPPRRPVGRPKIGSFGAFKDKYKPEPGLIKLDQLESTNRIQNNLWTAMRRPKINPNRDKLYISAGVHVDTGNVIGYIKTAEPWQDETEQYRY